MTKTFAVELAQPPELEPRPAGTVQSPRVSDLVAHAFEIIRRRWLTLLLVASVVFGAGVALVLSITPQFDAIAQVRIDPTRNPLATEQVDAVTSLSSEAINTEVAVLSSLELARTVVRELGLANDLEFAGKGEVSLPGVSEEARIDAVAQRLLRHLSVGREKLTYIINVRVTSRHPVKAARIANGFAAAYIENRAKSRVESAARQVAWFQEQIAKLAQDAGAAQAKAAQYRAETGTLQGGPLGTIADQQITPAAEQVAAAETAAAEAQANFAAAKALADQGEGEAIPAVRDANRALIQQRADVARRLGEITSRYGERHPDTIKARQELAAIADELSRETKDALRSLESRAQSTADRLDRARASLLALQSKQTASARANVEAQRLERDAEAKLAAYNRMEQMSLESTQSARNTIEGAEIVGRARPAQGSGSPSKPRLTAVALVLAFAAGLAAVAAQELTATGIRSIADVEQDLDLQVLGSIPKLKRRRSVKLPDNLITQPSSVFSSALRNAYISVLGARSTRFQRVIALTSTLPEEGKTTTALSLARVIAMGGTRTLLIDCDVHKAALKTMVQAKPAYGIGEVLRREAPPGKAIVADKVAGLDLMMITKTDARQTGLFEGERMAQLLDELRQQYRVILLDLPPLMGSPDARSLSVLADSVVLAVRWGATPLRAAQTALSWLRADGANLVGVLFTMVDPNSSALGAQYYMKRYGGYYG